MIKKRKFGMLPLETYFKILIFKIHHMHVNMEAMEIGLLLLELISLKAMINQAIVTILFNLTTLIKVQELSTVPV